MSLPNDTYGRAVTLTTVGAIDIYVVTTGPTVSFPKGAPITQVYNSINGMAPDSWTPPIQRTDVLMQTTDSTNATLDVYATSDGVLHVTTP